MIVVNNSMTAVIERNTTFNTDFVTEPYEVAWAREARWFFVPIKPIESGVNFRVVTEVSPDGLQWCALDEEAVDVGGSGSTTWASREFGGWLRLRGTMSTSGELRASIYLALKA